VLGAGHALVVRLHPMTVRRHPGMPAALAAKFGADPGRFRVVTDMNERESLLASDLMISDWSGAALDYAFGLERPVLFVDMPKKVNNPEFAKLALPPLEESVREEIGAILPLGEIATAPARIAALTADPAGFRDRIRRARERWIYQVGRSAEVAASRLARLLEAPVEAPHEKVAP
jgi:CDP-glycerol glycerophosphotransferase (TagB/SpsB family)